MPAPSTSRTTPQPVLLLGGVTVASGAALELQGGITVGAEALSINGTGVGANGALRNISGNNTWGGTVTLAGELRDPVRCGHADPQRGHVGGRYYPSADLRRRGQQSGRRCHHRHHGDADQERTGTLTLQGANTYTGATCGQRRHAGPERRQRFVVEQCIHREPGRHAHAGQQRGQQRESLERYVGTYAQRRRIQVHRQQCRGHQCGRNCRCADPADKRFHHYRRRRYRRLHPFDVYQRQQDCRRDRPVQGRQSGRNCGCRQHQYRFHHACTCELGRRQYDDGEQAGRYVGDWRYCCRPDLVSVL